MGEMFFAVPGGEQISFPTGTAQPKSIMTIQGAETGELTDFVDLSAENAVAIAGCGGRSCGAMRSGATGERHRHATAPMSAACKAVGGDTPHTADRESSCAAACGQERPVAMRRPVATGTAKDIAHWYRYGSRDMHGRPRKLPDNPPVLKTRW